MGQEEARKDEAHMLDVISSNKEHKSIPKGKDEVKEKENEIPSTGTDLLPPSKEQEKEDILENSGVDKKKNPPTNDAKLKRVPKKPNKQEKVEEPEMFSKSR